MANQDTATMTLSLRLSTVLASLVTQDGRDIDDARREMRVVAGERIGDASVIDVYSCLRHGGCLVEQYTRESLGLPGVHADMRYLD